MAQTQPRTQDASARMTALMTALAAMWLALFPFWQDGSYSRITHSKWVGMLVLTGVTVLVCCHVLSGLLRQGDRRALRAGAVQNLAVVYFALVALSAIFGTWHDFLNDELELTVLWGARRYEGLVTQLCYCIIFLCMSLVPPEPDGLLTAAADGLLVYTGMVGLQYLNVNVLGLFPEGRTIYTNYEFQGTIGNIDMVVGYVSLVMPLLLTAFVMRPRGGWLWLASGLAGVLLTLCMEVQCGVITLAALIFALLLLALRRPALRPRMAVLLGGCLLMLGLRMLLALPWLDGGDAPALRFSWTAATLLLTGAVLMALHGLLRRWTKPVSLQAIVIAVTVLAIAGFVLVYLAPIPSGNGLWELQQLLHGRMNDNFGSERIGIWRLTLEMSRKNLLFGTGPDTFLYAMNDHMKQTGQELSQIFDTPHNLFLAVLSNNGLPAMLVYMALFAAALALAWRRRKQQPFLIPLGMAAGCYILQGMFTFSLCLVTPMFWAVLGMLTACVNHREPTPPHERMDA